jgi:hypothetical protein
MEMATSTTAVIIILSIITVLRWFGSITNEGRSCFLQAGDWKIFNTCNADIPGFTDILRLEIGRYVSGWMVQWRFSGQLTTSITPFFLFFKAGAVTADLFMFDTPDTHFRHVFVVPYLVGRKFALLFDEDRESHSQHGKYHQYDG